MTELRNVSMLVGLPIDELSLAEACDRILEAIRNRQRCFLSTPNLNFVMQAKKDATFRQSILDSDLSLADGMPLLWIARMIGAPIPERVSGACLFEALRARHLTHPIRVFFFGGHGDSARLATNTLADPRSPGMEPVGFLNPGTGDIESMSTPEIIETINLAQPDFLVVALGAKKGQAWIQHNRERLNATVISHLGAVVNFTSGKVKRAPAFWQKSGFEWLWRIYREPSLWRRYWQDGLGLSHLLLSKIIPLAAMGYYYRKNERIHTNMETKSDPYDQKEIKIQGAPGRKEAFLLSSFVNQTQAKKVIIDLRDICWADPEFMAQLQLLQHIFQIRKGQTLEIIFGKRSQKLFNYYLYPNS